ncbi:MAG: GNAT family N-acetyltransferase [Alphaproteobacteria bacterium]
MKTAVITAVDAADIAACRAIREEVFVHEQNVPADYEWDEHEATATHFLLHAGGEPVGTARLRILGEVAKIERVAIRKPARGKGLGAVIMRHVLDIARRYPQVTTARLGGQDNAIAFYKRLGFEICSDAYMEAGILHYDMKLALR